MLADRSGSDHPQGLTADIDTRGAALGASRGGTTVMRYAPPGDIQERRHSPLRGWSCTCTRCIGHQNPRITRRFQVDVVVSDAVPRKQSKVSTGGSSDVCQGPSVPLLKIGDNRNGTLDLLRPERVGRIAVAAKLDLERVVSCRLPEQAGRFTLADRMSHQLVQKAGCKHDDLLAHHKHPRDRLWTGKRHGKSKSGSTAVCSSQRCYSSSSGTAEAKQRKIRVVSSCIVSVL